MNYVQVKYDSDNVRHNAPFKLMLQGDVGFDLYNASDATLIVAPYKSIQIPAGIRVKLPDNHGALVYPRSSTFKKKGLFVVPGLIDAGYVGPIFTFVWHPNLNEIDTPIFIEPWERLSQLIVIPVPQLVVHEVTKLPETERGNKGFGSTGL